MKRQAWVGAALLALCALLAASVGESAETDSSGFLQRVGPAGGWRPYGGVLVRWWDSHCFPRCGAADDYCRKSLPNVCWPPYPPYYIWGPPQPCCPKDSSRPANGKLH